MTNIINNELNRIRSLMKQPTITEAQKKAQDPVEYSTKGPDGNYYGIIREGSKYFIKQAAPNEKGQLIKENFEYIGGFSRRMSNQYDSFASAMRNLEGKLYSLKEAINANATLVECNTDRAKSKKIIIEAKGAIREDIKRQLQIMNNSQVLDEERSSYKPVGYTGTVDDDATPFSYDGGKENPIDSKGNPTLKSTPAYKEKVTKGGNSIIAQFAEAEDEEEVLNDNPERELGDGFNLDDEDADAVDLTDGLGDDELGDDELGDDFGAEGDDELGLGEDDEEGDDFEDDEQVFYITPDDLDNGEFNVKFKVGEPSETGEFDDENLYGDEDDDDFGGDDLGGDDLGGDLGDDLGGGMDTTSFDEEGGAGIGDEEEGSVKAEGFRRRGKRINEDRINFGKHPNYLKKPFTLPSAHAQYQNTVNWHDESVDNESEPFTNKMRYKYFPEKPQHIENSLALEEGVRRNGKKKIR